MYNRIGDNMNKEKIREFYGIVEKLIKTDNIEEFRRNNDDNYFVNFLKLNNSILREIKNKKEFEFQLMDMYACLLELGEKHPSLQDIKDIFAEKAYGNNNNNEKKKPNNPGLISLKETIRREFEEAIVPQEFEDLDLTRTIKDRFINYKNQLETMGNDYFSEEEKADLLNSINYIIEDADNKLNPQMNAEPVIVESVPKLPGI